MTCRVKQLLISTTLSLTALTAASVSAQTFPSQPLQIIVPYSAGGPIDSIARLLAEKMSSRLKNQPITVINKPGGENLIAARSLLNSRPDGYTLMLTTNGLLSVAPSMAIDFPIDTVKDFSYIGMVSAYPYVLATRAKDNAEPLSSYFERSLKDPESVSYVETGNVTVVAGAWLTSNLGIKMLPVRYKGAASAITDVTAGRVDISMAGPSLLLPLIESKSLRPLAVTSAKRLPQLPNTPTISEIDPRLKEYEVMVWTGLVAPVGLPKDVKQILEKAVQDTVADQTFKSKVEQLGDYTQWRSGEGMLETVMAELKIWKRVVEQSAVTTK